MISVDRVSRVAADVFHLVPRFRGRGRLLKLVNLAVTRGYSSTGRKPLAIARMKNGSRMKLDLRSDTEFQAFYTGDYDNSRISDMLSLFEEGWVVADVGANVGFYSVPFAARLARRNGHLYCFEPVPANFERLLENLRLNAVESATTPQSLALSDQVGEAEITLREDFELGGETGNAAILIQDGKDVRFRTVRVPLQTLDAFVGDADLLRLDFVKVDIEGHEDAFFRGAARSIERFRPIILAEMNEDFFRRKGVDIDQDVRREFLARKYVFLAQRRRSGEWERVESLKGRAVAEDILLVPEEKLERVLALLNS